MPVLLHSVCCLAPLVPAAARSGSLAGGASILALIVNDRPLLEQIAKTYTMTRGGVLAARRSGMELMTNSTKLFASDFFSKDALSRPYP